MKPSGITIDLIAPCGINCGVCIAHLRGENVCPGCRLMNKTNRKYVKRCPMKICLKRPGKYCFSCDEYPCSRMQRLDKRYRARYGMSEMENLAYIKEHGIKAFVKKEQKRWKCPECGNLMSCHKVECITCTGSSALKPIKKSNKKS